MSEKKLSRRNFLRLSALTTAGAVLAACVPVAPQATTGSSSEVVDAPSGAEEVALKFWMWNTFAPPADEIMNTKLNEWAGENNVKIEISRAGKSGSRKGTAPAPSDQLTLNLTAKTYRYLEEGETPGPAADDDKAKGKAKKGGKTRREEEKGS